MNDERAEDTVQFWLKVFDEAYRLHKSGLNKEQIETSHAITIAGQVTTNVEMKNAQQSSRFVIELACAFADNNEVTFEDARADVEDEIRAQIAEHKKQGQKSS
jgi:hypothetical protein